MKFFIIPAAVVMLLFLVCCNSVSNKPKKEDHRVVLVRDTMNTVKMTDTLVIGESVCRGCAYEGSIQFDIADSLHLVKLLAIETNDDHPSDMNGGYIGKTIVLAPVKPGTTTIRLYKIYSSKTAAADSLHPASYSITVENQ